MRRLGEAAALRAAAARSRKGRGRPPAANTCSSRACCDASVVRRWCRAAVATGSKRRTSSIAAMGVTTAPIRAHAPQPRALIDAAVYRYFEQVGLDVEGTRQTSRRRSSDGWRGRALRREAEREAQLATGDWPEFGGTTKTAGSRPSDWAEHRAVDGGARGRPGRGRASRRLGVGGRARWRHADAEHEVLTVADRIRRAITGEIRDAEGVDAVGPHSRGSSSAS